MSDRYSEIKPGRKRFKMKVIKTVLFILGRSLQSASKLDKSIKKELNEWPEGFSFMMKVQPDGPKMSMVRNKSGCLEYRGNRLKENDVDLIILFKNVECAFMTFTAQLSTPQAYAEHRISVKGDLAMVMSLMRCLNVIQAYLYPKIIAKLAVKRVPHIPFFLKQWNRIRIYMLGIPFGI